MQDLSLHILDIAQNSVRAQAKNIEIHLTENISHNQLVLSIKDDGKGMSETFVKNVTDPFTTTRTLRRVGLGLPFLKQNCEQCEGGLTIQSELGKGTLVTAEMQYNHIDRVPIGDLASTIVTLIQGAPEIELIYEHIYENKALIFSTIEIKKILGDVPINELAIVEWLKQYLNEQIQQIRQ